MISWNNSSQSTRPTGRVLGKNYSSFLDFTSNYARGSVIFVPCSIVAGLWIRVLIGKLFILFLIQNICCGYSKEPSQ